MHDEVSGLRYTYIFIYLSVANHLRIAPRYAVDIISILHLVNLHFFSSLCICFSSLSNDFKFQFQHFYTILNSTSKKTIFVLHISVPPSSRSEILHRMIEVGLIPNEIWKPIKLDNLCILSNIISNSIVRYTRSKVEAEEETFVWCVPWEGLSHLKNCDLVL